MSFGMVQWMWVCCAQLPVHCSTMIFHHIEPVATAQVFYQFAREYFSSLCRVLTMDVSLLQNG